MLEILAGNHYSQRRVRNSSAGRPGEPGRPIQEGGRRTILTSVANTLNMLKSFDFV
jgi:hypothetical protein